MAIRLPDIVQSVVLDTRRFSRGSKALTSGYGQIGGAAEKAGRGHSRHQKELEAGGKAADKHEGRLRRLNSTIKRSAPGVLNLANNFFKARAGMDGTSRSSGRLNGMFTKLYGRLKGLITGVVRFGAKWGAVGAGLLAAIPAVAGLAGGLIALAGSLSRAAGILPALAGGLASLASLGGVGALLFAGMGDALKKTAKAGEGAGATAKKVADSQRGIADATRGVADARRDEAKAYDEIGKTAYEAQRRVSDATRAQTIAQNTLAEAQARARGAQDALNRSYAEAVEHLEDLRRASERADISEERAELSLREAERRLAEIQSDPEATADDVISATLDLRSAELDLADARDENAESQKQLIDGERKGIKNSDLVVDARNDLRDANNEVADSAYDLRQAELDLYDAQKAAVTDVADARERAADATRNVEDAVRSLADAERNLAEARDGGASGTDDGRGATAAEQQLAKAFENAKKRLGPLREAAQAVAFPGMIVGLEVGMRLLERFRGRITDTAGIIGVAATQLPTAFESVAPELDIIWDSANRLSRSLLNLFTGAIIAAGRFVSAGSFVIDYFARLNDIMGLNLVAMTEGEEARGRMQAFFLRALGSAITWGHIVRDLFWGVVNIFRAGTDAGDTLSRSIESNVARFRDWTESVSGKNALRDFFEDAGRITRSIFRITGRIIGSMSGLATGVSLDIVANSLERIERSEKFAALLDKISAFSDKGLAGLVDGLRSIYDVFTGKKDPKTETEKMASSFGKLSDLTEPLGTFANAFTKIIDALMWASDNIPGFNTLLGGIATLAAVKFVAGKTGITGAMSSVVGIFSTIQGLRYGPKTMVRELREIKTTLAGPADTSGIAGVATATERAATRTERAQARISRAWSRVKGAVARRGKAAPVAAPEPQTPSPAALGPGAVTGVGTMTQGLDGGTKKMDRFANSASGAGGSVMALGAAGIMAGQMIGGDMGENIAKASTIVTGLGGVMSTLPMLMNPIGLTVMAIVAAGAALYMLYKKNEGFKRFIDDLWQRIQTMWDAVLPILRDMWAWISVRVIEGFKRWATVANWWWNSVLMPIFTAVWSYIVNVLIPGWKIILTVASEVFTKVAAVISWWWSNVVSPIFNLAWSYITNVLIPVWTRIFTVAYTVFKAVADIVSWAWTNVIRPTFNLIWQIISVTLVPIFQALWDKISTVFSFIKDAIRVAWEFIKPKFQSLVDFIKNPVIPVFQSIADKVSSVFGAIGGFVERGMNAAKDKIRSAMRVIGNLVAPVLRVLGGIADKVGLSDVASKLNSGADSADSWGEIRAAGGIVGARDVGSAAGLAAGGHMPWSNAPRTKVGAGFKTGTPRAIVGEGSRHPEYVIPTDPKYRDRAWALVKSAAADLNVGPKRGGGLQPEKAGTPKGAERFAIGGWLSDPVKSFKNAVGDTVDWATAPFDAIYAKVKELGVKALENIMPKFDIGADQSIMDIPRGGFNKIREALFNKLAGETVAKGDAQNGTIYGAYSGPLNSITGLHPVFKERFDRYSNAVGGLNIGSGWRSSAVQARLYADWLAGKPGQAQAAPPGTSNHEFGLAIDHNPNSTAAMRETAKSFNLRYPMSFEDWHVEPNEARQWRASGQASQKGYGAAVNAAPGSANPTDNKALGKAMLEARGWGQHWGPLERLWDHESNWNHLASNPSSGAYGIPQSLPGNKMATHGADWRTNPATQIGWGLDYIAGRRDYGNPTVAWQKWLSRSPHWYDHGGFLDNVPQLADGGIAMEDTLARIGEMGRPEAIVPLNSVRGRSMLGSEGATITFENGAFQVHIKVADKADIPNVEAAITTAFKKANELIVAGLED